MKKEYYLIRIVVTLTFPFIFIPWEVFANKPCGEKTNYGLENTIMGAWSSVSKNTNIDKCEDDLSISYRLYAQIKECHKARQGYMSVYVNDVEMRKAKDLVKKVETAIVKKNPSLHSRKNSIWDRETGNIEDSNSGQDAGIVSDIPSNYDKRISAFCGGAVMVFTEISKQYLGSGSDKDF